jgi:hypothetical protein
MFGWIYNTIFGVEKVKDATAPVPVSAAAAEEVKAAPVPVPAAQAQSAKASAPVPAAQAHPAKASAPIPATQAQPAKAKPSTAKRARPADVEATPSGAPIKVAKTVSGGKVSHVEGDWSVTFMKVDSYVKRVGILDDIGEEEPALAEWLNRQQSNATSLTTVQKKQLDSIGATDVNIKSKTPLKTPSKTPGDQGGTPKTPKTRVRTPKFEVMFERLLAFKIVYGDTQVASTYEDGQLAKWARRQRLLYSQKERGLKDKISNEHIEQLDSIGFAWKLKRGRPKNSLNKNGSVDGSSA